MIDNDRTDSDGTGSGRIDTAVLDVDGTLVDSNYQHAIAWHRAFRRYRITLPLWRLHQAIGMGGDQLVAAVADEDVEHRLGDDLRGAWAEEFDPLLTEVAPFDGVPGLLRELRERGFRIVLASSGKAEHVEHYLGLFDGKQLADGWTTSDDVAHTKPAPDLVEVAVRAVDGTAGAMVGDSVWDFRAAAKLGTPGYAVRSGGFSVDELCAAGAREVFDSPDELRRRLDETLLAAPG